MDLYSYDNCIDIYRYQVVLNNRLLNFLDSNIMDLLFVYLSVILLLISNYLNLVNMYFYDIGFSFILEYRVSFLNR